METKVCTKCGEDKSLDLFMRHTGIKSGRGPRCKACNAAYYAQRRIYKYTEVREYEKKFHAERRLRYEYGTTKEAIEQVKESQGHACAICKEALPLVIDHCHVKGKGHFRGLLCSPCNLGLGHFKDDPVRIKEAIKYLERR